MILSISVFLITVLPQYQSCLSTSPTSVPVLPQPVLSQCQSCLSTSPASVPVLPQPVLPQYQSCLSTRLHPSQLLFASGFVVKGGVEVWMYSWYFQLVSQGWVKLVVWSWLKYWQHAARAITVGGNSVMVTAIFISFVHSPPVLSEGMEDAYLVCKTDTADCTYSLDSPGT